MADTTPPTIAITSNKTALKAGDTALITFTLSEVATDFLLSDIIVSGGTLSNFSGSGLNYSSIFTPNQNSTAQGGVSVGNFKFSDNAGNANEDGSDANNRLFFNIDTVKPTVSISSSRTYLGFNESATIKFSLSEPSDNFEITDIYVSGGTLESFKGSGTNYTAIFWPNANSDLGIQVIQYSFTDSLGNFNIGSSKVLLTPFDPLNANVIWTRLNGSSSSDVATSLATGLDGSIYLCRHSLNNSGLIEGFLEKFNPEGSNLWTISLGTCNVNNTATTYKLSIGIDGGIYVTSDNSNLVSGRASVSKYNPSGEKIWTTVLSKESTNSFVYINAITTGPDGYLYVSGLLDGQSGNNFDYCLTKLNPNGVKAWTISLNSSPSALITDQEGSVYACGSVAGTLDGQNNSGGYDTFLTKFTSSGTKLWTRLIGSSGDEFGTSLTIGLDGSIYVCGHTSGSLDGQSNKGRDDSFVTKFKADGTKVWTRTIGDKYYDAAVSLSTATDGSIIVSGTTYSLELNGQKSNGGSDVFVTQINTDGTIIWTRLLGNEQYDLTNGFNDEGALTTGVDGSIYVAGSTRGMLDGQVNSGESDAFLIKLTTPDRSLPIIELIATKSTLSIGESIEISFILNKPSNNFIATDIVVHGGTLSNFQGSGKSYTAIFTPTIEGASGAFVSVGSGKFSDALGFFNEDGADANNKVTFTVKIPPDTTPPTIAVTSNTNSLSSLQTALLTFTLSEASTNFTVSDVNVAGGALSNFSGSGTSYTAMFTPTANSTATGTVRVANSVFTDAAGNNNADGSDANNTITLAIDTVAPTIALSSSKSSLFAGDTCTLTFTLSEASTTFTAADVTVTGGTLSNFTGRGVSYTALFTPIANSITNGTVSVSSGVFTDTAGNNNADGSDTNNTISLIVDTVVPTIALSSSKTSLIAGDRTNLTFTLSEASTTFNASDVNVTGGALTNFTGSGTSYSALFTPTANSTANGVISVVSGVFTDEAGNTNTDGSEANNTISLIVDTVVPTIAVSSNKSSLQGGDTAILTFTLSEASTTFTAADVTVTGGTLSNFTGRGVSYTALFTPIANSITNGTVSVSSGVFTDTAGNNNADGSDTNNTISLIVDTVVPTIALSSSKTSLIAGDRTNLTFTLSEASTTFNASDVNVTGGALTNFTGSGTSYSALFTPTANSTANGVISVVSGVFTDEAGNTNTDGADNNNSFTFVVDTVIPSIALSTSKNRLIAGELATLSFVLSEASASFTASDVTVTGGTISNFAGSGTTYTATFTLAANSTASGLVSVASGVFTDYAGNANADGSDVNNSITFVINNAPIANAGPQQYVQVGAAVTLNGANSSDPNGDQLSYRWSTVLKPINSASVLTNQASAQPVFVADLVGTYIFSLVVNDGRLDSATSFITVEVSIPNAPPIANAGSNQNVVIGPVTLDGSASSDADGDTLTYKWFLVAKPNNSTATLVSPTAQKPTINTDIAGVYVFTLIVSDGKLDSSPVTTSITVNALPAPDITPPTIRIFAETAGLIAGQTKTITFYLSEPSSNFVASDVNATGGTLSNWVGYGNTYTALFTPSANTTANGVISVLSSVFTDAAGNANADGSDANNSVVFSIDTVVPTISLSTNKSSLNSGETAIVNFTISEPSINFTFSDVTVIGGTLSNFSGSGTAYSATFTPAVNSSINGVVSVSSGVFTDLAGNTNLDGFDSNNAVSIAQVVKDLAPPSPISFSPSLGETNVDVSRNIVITFNEKIQRGAGVIDIRLGHPKLGNLLESFNVATSDRLTYDGTTLTINPTRDLKGNYYLFIYLADGAVQDSAGNKSANISYYTISTANQITTEYYSLSVVVNKGVLGAEPVLLKGLTESIVFENGYTKKHIVEYAGSTFDYNQIDSLIMTVTRDGEFTEEFTREINDYVKTELNISYSAAVAIVGATTIDDVILTVAGSDGNYVG
jgi:hypothetical protein